METKVSKEQAQIEFDRFIEAMDIESDAAFMTDADFKNFEAVETRLLRAIMHGSLEISDSGEAVYTPYRSGEKLAQPITFSENSGAVGEAADAFGPNQVVRKTFAMMAKLTGQPAKTFAKLKGRDNSNCRDLFVLLMD